MDEETVVHPELPPREEAIAALAAEDGRLAIKNTLQWYLAAVRSAENHAAYRDEDALGDWTDERADEFARFFEEHAKTAPEELLAWHRMLLRDEECPDLILAFGVFRDKK